jgi:hypothetical protein
MLRPMIGCVLRRQLYALESCLNLAQFGIGNALALAIRIVIREVSMQFMKWSTVQASRNVISGILNCVCPDCGGRMGERGKEFKCQGECQKDWRQIWESIHLGTDHSWTQAV